LYGLYRRKLSIADFRIFEKSIESYCRNWDELSIVPNSPLCIRSWKSEVEALLHLSLVCWLSAEWKTVRLEEKVRTSSFLLPSPFPLQCSSAGQQEFFPVTVAESSLLSFQWSEIPSHHAPPTRGAKHQTSPPFQMFSLNNMGPSSKFFFHVSPQFWGIAVFYRCYIYNYILNNFMTVNNAFI
jgi:hypothetical protein